VRFRVGQGWDLHRCAPSGPLTLGGLAVEADFHLVGHSDADVLLHAIIDAMLGAAGLGDIGMSFPDTDAAYKGAPSGELLKKTADDVARRGWSVLNVDATVILQNPRLGELKGRMGREIARILGIDAACVSVKAKTAEGLGPVGKGEAVEAQAVCLLGARGEN